MPPSLILASQSTTRRLLLQNAGLDVECHPTHLDESAIKAALKVKNALPRDVADVLADMKARRIAQKYPDKVVIGADQVLVHKGRIFDKPTTFDEAKSQLLTLRGQTHLLLSAVVIYNKAAPVWRHIGRAELTMRDFSRAFLETYCAELGDDLFTTVGGYKLESLGSQLFLSVKGDYFSILGLPLLAVLDFLRGQGICQT